jgi:hypothetical protein
MSTDSLQGRLTFSLDSFAAPCLHGYAIMTAIKEASHEVLSAIGRSFIPHCTMEEAGYLL